MEKQSGYETHDIQQPDKSSDIDFNNLDKNDKTTYNLVRDRERRIVKPTKRYGQSELLTFALIEANEEVQIEPKTYKEAITNSEAEHWNLAIQEQIESLYKNNTWEWVVKLVNFKLIGSKWIYKKKEGIPSMEKPRYKTKLVVKGFTQKEGIYYNEIFSPIVRHNSIRLLLTATTYFDIHLE